MSDTQSIDNRTLKEYAIDTYEIVIRNFMISLYDLEPQNIIKQISEDTNHIFWILGHCTSHVDIVLGQQCQGKSVLSKEQHKHFGYGIAKELAHQKPEISYLDFIEHFITITDNALEFLKNLPEEKYRELPQYPGENSNNVSILMEIQIIALHLMGHMGQITAIRRKLGNPVPYGFVAGKTKESRDKIYAGFLRKWKESKDNFSK